MRIMREMERAQSLLKSYKSMKFIFKQKPDYYMYRRL